MPVTRVQVIIPSATGVPRNNFVNTFHFFSPGDFVTADQGEEIRDRLELFYKGDGTIGVTHLSDFLSPAVASAGDWTVKCTDLASPAPQVPYFEGTFEGPATGLSPLPSEAAVCLSFKANPESGLNPANRRGRIYFGPLNSNAVATVVGDVAVAVALRQTLLDEALVLVAPGGLPGSPQWIGWSSTLQLPFDIGQFWVDDAMDTQRRRGTAARVRSTVSVP